MDKIIIHTDGSFSSKTKKGGYAFVCDYPFVNTEDENSIERRIVYNDGDFYRAFELLCIPTDNYRETNQVMELSAIAVSLIACKNQIRKNIKRSVNVISEIEIHTDSMYIVKSFNDYIKKWSVNDWKKADGKCIKNKELILYIYEKINYLKKKGVSVVISHVRSHLPDETSINNKYNNICDELAKKHSMV